MYMYMYIVLCKVCVCYEICGEGARQGPYWDPWNPLAVRSVPAIPTCIHLRDGPI